MRPTLIALALAILSAALGSLFIVTMQGHPLLGLLDNLVVAASSLIVAVAFWILFRKINASKRDLKSGWLIAVLGFTSWALADIWWLVQETLGVKIPLGTWTDFFWLLGFALIIVGMIILIWNLFFSSKLIWLAVAGIVVSLALYFFVQLRLHGQFISDDWVQQIQQLYVVLEIILIGLCSLFVFPLLASRNRFVAVWILFALGIAARCIFDIGFALLTSANAYWSGHYIDVLYLLSFAMLAFAADMKYRVMTERLVK